MHLHKLFITTVFRKGRWCSEMCKMLLLLLFTCYCAIFTSLARPQNEQPDPVSQPKMLKFPAKINFSSTILNIKWKISPQTTTTDKTKLVTNRAL